ncbi:MAG TPA: helix-turn-helix domain-containing protein, partial [Saprospiraceae bacterium]|nr:helix-turn-helix domain-containing protein [Saprospiraceae bacterium]
PIVLLTAKASVESRIAGLSRGADAYLAKPFHREELTWTLSNLIRAREVLQAHLRAVLRTADPDDQTSAAILPQSVQAVAETEDAFVQKLRLYIEGHLGNTGLSMEELSRAMTMSYQNLHRKLTALTNLSPVQFIRAIRLQKAMALLRTSQMSIADIALQVGFNDPKYFTRVFTEEFGKSPSAIRG